MVARVFSKMFTVTPEMYNEHGPEHYMELLHHAVLEEIELQGYTPLGVPKFGVHRHAEHFDEHGVSVMAAWVEFHCSYLADVYTQVPSMPGPQR